MKLGKTLAQLTYSGFKVTFEDGPLDEGSSMKMTLDHGSHYRTHVYSLKELASARTSINTILNRRLWNMHASIRKQQTQEIQSEQD